MTLILASKPLSNSPSLYLQFLVRLFYPPTLSELVWKKRFCRLDLCHKTLGFSFQTRIISGESKHPVDDSQETDGELVEIFSMF